MIPPDARRHSAQAGADTAAVALQRAWKQGAHSMTVTAGLQLVAAYLALAFVGAIVFGLL